MPDPKASLETGKHIRGVLLLPVMATVVPATVPLFTGKTPLDLWERVPVSRLVLAVVGVPFVGVGLTRMGSTIQLFAGVGKGTLAPWNPTQKLIVQGCYRHVRNP